MFFSKEHSELCDWEKDEKIPKRNIKHAKVFSMIVKIYLNGEFIEVPFTIIVKIYLNGEFIEVPLMFILQSQMIRKLRDIEL